MTPLTINLKDTRLSDLPEVGGKNASLGELFSQLGGKGIEVPEGFAVTVSAFRLFIEENGLRLPLQNLMDRLDKTNFSNLQEVGKAARELILQAEITNSLAPAVVKEYCRLSGKNDVAVAVRSSATGEDLPNASFAGQHDSFLNISGEPDL